MRIFLNPGHAPNGVPDPGCTNYKCQAYEYEIAANVALMVERMLTGSGYEVMTYQDDSLAAITEAANDWGADYFVSIHVNDYVNHSVHGCETYCFDTLSAGGDLAKSIQEKLVSQLKLVNRGVKEANYWVIRKTNMPAVLVEMGFINSSDIKILQTKQVEYAKAIYQGIVNCLEE